MSSYKTTRIQNADTISKCALKILTSILTMQMDPVHLMSNVMIQAADE
jgi:hypothetical protein